MEFRIRRVLPEQAETVWHSVEAATAAEAVMEDFYGDARGVNYYPRPEALGHRIVFAAYEVEGHGELVARVYKSGIVRKGGVTRPGWPPRLEDVARQLGWEKDPAELLAPGWELEEQDWS